MKKQFENLLLQFSEELMNIGGEENALEQLNQIERLSARMIHEIKEILTAQPFENEMEEIEFFKQVNPRILSPSIEQGLKYYILINKPITTNEALVDYFEDALKNLQSFFSMNSFHYQYFKSGIRELDHLYFLTSAGPLSIPIIEIHTQMKVYCPAMSYLFAKFLAYENVQYYIIEEISGLRTSNIVASMQVDAAETPELKWTGESINIIELAYGLWLTGQLNNGNASLNQIIRWLEKNLSVSIGIAQRKFSEISRRKRISITKFIDQMRDAILKKIDAGYE